jgi:hypothetical protein
VEEQVAKLGKTFRLPDVETLIPNLVVEWFKTPASYSGGQGLNLDPPETGHPD